ncbi:MAG: hypothetical protein R3B13_10240 [Polyangiaceae bacterium]
MKTFSLLALFCALPIAVACGSDDDKPSGNTGGTGGGGTGGGSAGTGGGSAGTGGGSAGTGGSGGASCDLSGAGLTKEKIPNKISADMTLTNDKVWTLEDTTYVEDGATLTIQPCTRIEGKKTPLGTLVVSRGGKIMADGKADEPILFTSALPAGSRNAGDWGGVIMLGKAPNFKGDNVTIEGLADAPENQYGGTVADDDSGVMRFVRIEFSGFELSADNEINGLTLGSVGSKTVLENIMISNTLDDCFEWFGGTVNGKYLVCNNGGDDMFDMDQGYSGNLQFLFGRQVTPLSSNPNGFECDSDNGGATPVSKPNVSNVTLCGTGSAGTDVAFGGVLRENLEGKYMNLLITKFDIGIDARDDFGTVGSPKTDITHSVFFGNFAHNISDPSEADNDNGFDENAWIKDSSRNNSEADPQIGDCSAATPAPQPASMIAGGTPGAGMETSATYVGAFKDGSDNWMTGLWISWAKN